MLPDNVNVTVEALCSALTKRLGDRLQNVYLYGSVALGDYIEGSSDIDFLAVVDQPLSGSEIKVVAAAHDEVEQSLPGTNMMGAYLLRSELGQSLHDTSSVVTYFEKRLRTDGTGADLNPVTWWVLKHHGIRVYGPEVLLTYEIAEDTMTDYVIGNMNTYWTDWIGRLEQHARTSGPSGPQLKPAELDFAVEWCVLGMLRQLYTIRERKVTSKTEAGRYGLELLHARWHGLIREAIAIKRLQPERTYDSQLHRLNELIELLRLIHADSNRAYSG
ncbi:nucleotidyltransferase domain-containing protein [Paenibacillus humicola]|uniref:nucleotidyltransferase domain-containing protein n=1 Tax=Paenibacillus humicola TaxID=3110540 RepID=UPI00237AD3E7|nr:nucleotidyltransferase domain-containing protein [Paenibacillus humicola]